jgi:hypothetical protein
MEFPPFYFGGTIIFFAGIRMELKPKAETAIRLLIEAAPYPVKLPMLHRAIMDDLRNVQRQLRLNKVPWHIRCYSFKQLARFALEPDGMKPQIRRQGAWSKKAAPATDDLAEVRAHIARSVELEARALRLFGPAIGDAERLIHQHKPLYPRRDGALVTLEAADQAHHV